MKQFDAIIVGGGLAGSALAVGLARSGRTVGLIEAAPRNSDNRPSFDDRTLVVNAASLNILSALDILTPDLQACPIRRIEISRSGAPGHLVLEAEEHDCERFGAVIVARELGAAMLNSLARTDGIVEFCPARVATIRADEAGVRVQLEDGSELTGALLVGADGSRSIVRRQASIDSRQYDYGQSAMIFNVLPAQRPADTARERFTPDGPLALLPQPEGRLGVVWIGSSADIDEAMSLDDNNLARRLAQRCGPGAGGFSRPGKRARYPLALTRTTHPVARRTVVVGNAANTLHPVSAQGFNLGLRDVAALIDALAQVDDPGSPACLDQWAAARRHDQAATVRYTDTLARAFTNPSLAFRTGTGLGLAAHAAFPALRRRLVRAAMGFREPVSSLAAGEGR